MKKLLCLVFAMLLALCACSSGKSTPKRPAVTSSERQFTTPAEGDTIAIFTTSQG